MRYECALIRYWLEDTPVFPVFASEITGKNQEVLQFEKINFKIEFPEVPHARGEDAQDIIDELRYNTNSITSMNKENMQRLHEIR